MSFTVQITSVQELGNALRSARKEQRLSQRELAQRCGCSQRLVSEIERGKQTAEVGKAFLLLSTLGLSFVIQSDNPAGAGREAIADVARTVVERLERQNRARTSLDDYL